MLLHASCVALRDDAVLLLGPSGSGKSDLVLRLIQDPLWRMVADDQVEVVADGPRLRAGGPRALRGRLEVRGLGILEDVPVAASARPELALAVHLAPRAAVPRLPEPSQWQCEGCALPAVTLHAFDASTPAKIALALAAVRGHRSLVAGAFPSPARAR
jgi:HPr kinase/phosphorylase